MAYLWTCTCGETGEETRDLKTDAATADYKHTAACGQTVLTGTDAASLARKVARMKGAAA